MVRELDLLPWKVKGKRIYRELEKKLYYISWLSELPDLSSNLMLLNLSLPGVKVYILILRITHSPPASVSHWEQYWYFGQDNSLLQDWLFGIPSLHSLNVWCIPHHDH